ncbi:MAG TPA: phosphoribosylformylglycinamidine synthase subunit PurS [Salinivirgaceae bacterium]|nr:phosphoribosylformylglycinamidine synthase subunit PurS [Salinivirgaceae bacterium]
MKFFAEIDIMPLKALLDPQGKAVTNVLHNMGYKKIENLRVGKHMTLEIEAKDMENAKKIIEEICQKVLTNPIMESYEYRIKACE